MRPKPERRTVASVGDACGVTAHGDLRIDEIGDALELVRVSRSGRIIRRLGRLDRVELLELADMCLDAHARLTRRAAMLHEVPPADRGEP